MSDSSARLRPWTIEIQWIEGCLKNFSQQIQQNWRESFPHTSSAYDVASAVEYALCGGKHLRPLLFVLSYEMIMGALPSEDVLMWGLSLEMIHAYSLIHDDLPCMDDDDVRRGKPTLHRAFREDTAVLAGDCLLTLAMQEALQAMQQQPMEQWDASMRAFSYLVQQAGLAGMLGGQVLDLDGQQLNDGSAIEQMVAMKTGALFSAAVVLPGILCGCSSDEIEQLQRFAHYFSLAFQAQDDWLDRKKDEAEQKVTLIQGLEERQAQRYIQEQVHQALNALDIFPSSQRLRELCQALIGRKE